MFGMGFLEIFLVLLVAIIALGPEKLPGAMVDTAKFFKKLKGEITDAKSTLDKELDLTSMKEDTQKLKESVSNIQQIANIDLDSITNINTDEPTTPKAKEPETIQTKTDTTNKKEKIPMDGDKKA